jgi:hypothetical protein
MSFKASSESTVIIPLGGDKRGLVGLFLRAYWGGMLKMVRLGESALRFVSHKAYIMGGIRVNCEIGGPHV